MRAAPDLWWGIVDPSVHMWSVDGVGGTKSEPQRWVRSLVGMVVWGFSDTGMSQPSVPLEFLKIRVTYAGVADSSTVLGVMWMPAARISSIVWARSGSVPGGGGGG